MTGERAGLGFGIRSCLLAFLCAGVIFGAVIVPATPASASTDRLSIKGTFMRPGGTGGRANGELLFRPKARRFYQAVRTTGMTLTEYDADTLNKLRSVELPRFAVSLTTIGESAWLWAMDEDHGRIFAVVMTEGFGEYTYSLLTLNLSNFRFTVSPPLYETARVPLSISYHASSDKLYLLSKLQMNAVRDVAFLEERDTAARQTWNHPLSNCASIGDDLLAPIVARSVLNPSRIYLNCYTKNIAQSAVDRITIGPSGVVDDEMFPAVPKAVSGVLFDPGSDRIFFLATNGGAGRGAWVFDGEKGEFLGVIASGDTRDGENDYAIGLDEKTGRIYVQTPAGFLVADGRRTPLDAGYVFRDLSGPGLAPIHVDSGARRVFAPDPRGSRGQGWPTSYVVLQDDIRLTADPPAASPDSLTADVPEKPGVTDRTYSGSASAFAVRSLTTGGLQRAAWNATLADFDPERIPVLWPALRDGPVSNENRDFVAAHVIGLTLTPNSADAVSSGVTADDGSRRDGKSLGVEWPYATSECHTSGQAVSDGESNSAAKCDPSNALSSASAGVSGVSSTSLAVPGVGDVRFDSVWSEASSRLDPREGLVTESSAVVKGLSLFGRVRIGELRAVAVAKARGRRGSASAVHDRTFTNVWIQREEGPPYTCDVCDPREVLEQINRSLTGTATASMPQPDPEFYPNGSPGGYQSIIRRNEFESYTARSMNDDDALEIPGLEIVAFSDGRAGRTRHILQFAAVLAESHYGIFLIPSALPDPGPGPVIVLPRVPIVAPPVTVAPPEVAPSGPTIETSFERIIKRVAAGYRFFGANMRRASLFALMWAFLFLPVYLLTRRRKIA